MLQTHQEKPANGMIQWAVYSPNLYSHLHDCTNPSCSVNFVKRMQVASLYIPERGGAASVPAPNTSPCHLLKSSPQRGDWKQVEAFPLKAVVRLPLLDFRFATRMRGRLFLSGPTYHVRSTSLRAAILSVRHDSKCRRIWSLRLLSN